jgi:PTH1 family peptidyl-tRNA hydrolase
VPLVLGLGNPGARYAATRHNVGWRVLETLERRWRWVGSESGERWRAVRIEARGRTLDLLYPLAFMNLSGEALDDWRMTHALEPGELLVVSDDVYLPVGTLRLRERGSSGGHRGLESLERSLGGETYARLRIGVGQAAAAGLREHVLETFEADEVEAVEASIALAADAVECWADEGMRSAMNRFNRKVKSEEESET